MDKDPSPRRESRPKRLVILGSTGSIGANVLDVVSRFPSRFEVAGLGAGKNVPLLEEQIARFKPERVCVLQQKDAREIGSRITGPEVLWGEEGYVDLALTEGVDLVVSSQVGASGLRPTYAAVKAGRVIGLANKETLVAAGEPMMAEASRSGAVILPIDSEHSAIYQSVVGHNSREIRRIILTASGGPFRTMGRERMASITVEDALDHPTWNMGAKITVDSATLMNKGLEVIEAHWLFGVAIEAIDVHVHPQSIVHSMVEYIDGSIVAQLGIPDMRVPIAYALSYPERLPLDLPPLDLFSMGSLTFERPDRERFPCLALAFAAGREGGTMPAVLNAANEVAVELFLERRIGFADIPRLVSRAMELHRRVPVESLEHVLEVDRETRTLVRRLPEG